MISNNGCWIFLSHSSADIEKVRIIRNEFEKYDQNPLAFHLKCLNTDTEENKNELFDLIKREIESRDWFVYCESSSAEESPFVKMEREYVSKCKKVFIWRIDLDDDVETIKQKVRDICIDLQVYVAYAYKDLEIVAPLIKDLKKNDFNVWCPDNLNAYQTRLEETIDNISRKGFFLFICTKNSINSPFVIQEVKKARINEAKIITLVFDNCDIPDDIIKLLDKKNVYHIPEVPKDEDYYLLTNLVKTSLKRRIDRGIEIKADVFNAETLLQEKLNYSNNYHSKEAVHVSNLGPADDYAEVYEFPCCGKRVFVGDGPISRFRCDGCCKEEK